MKILFSDLKKKREGKSKEEKERNDVGREKEGKGREKKEKLKFLLLGL